MILCQPSNMIWKSSDTNINTNKNKNTNFVLFDDPNPHDDDGDGGVAWITVSFAVLWKGWAESGWHAIAHRSPDEDYKDDDDYGDRWHVVWIGQKR